MSGTATRTAGGIGKGHRNREGNSPDPGDEPLDSGAARRVESNPLDRRLTPIRVALSQSHSDDLSGVQLRLDRKPVKFRRGTAAVSEEDPDIRPLRDISREGVRCRSTRKPEDGPIGQPIRCFGLKHPGTAPPHGRRLPNQAATDRARRIAPPFRIVTFEASRFDSTRPGKETTA